MTHPHRSALRFRIPIAPSSASPSISRRLRLHRAALPPPPPPSASPSIPCHRLCPPPSASTSPVPSPPSVPTPPRRSRRAAGHRIYPPPPPRRVGNTVLPPSTAASASTACAASSRPHLSSSKFGQTETETEFIGPDFFWMKFGPNFSKTKMTEKPKTEDRDRNFRLDRTPTPTHSGNRETSINYDLCHRRSGSYKLAHLVIVPQCQRDLSVAVDDGSSLAADNIRARFRWSRYVHQRFFALPIDMRKDWIWMQIGKK
uniref:Uncharacterized protein n=1 Tax=Oryza sativa subsp. japonica TaxID=39947 RepID=Q84ZD1_ORYSJ|nr:hypothetical protein [Oryza sativa Japonica Group]